MAPIARRRRAYLVELLQEVEKARGCSRERGLSGFRAVIHDCVMDLAFDLTNSGFREQINDGPISPFLFESGIDTRDEIRRRSMDSERRRPTYCAQREQPSERKRRLGVPYALRA